MIIHALTAFVQKIVLTSVVIVGFSAVGIIGNRVMKPNSHIADTVSRIPALTDSEYFGFVDFTMPANAPRFFVVRSKDLAIVYQWYTSHGSGSGPRNGSGLKFSNAKGSKMSSAGLYRVREIYMGKNGKSRRLEGLEKGVNDNARARAIVIHPANYVTDVHVLLTGYPGRSQGCITLNPADKELVYSLLSSGSHLYVYK